MSAIKPTKPVKTVTDPSVAAAEKRYYSAIELEALTGTPRSTWRWWAQHGQGPASVKIGRRLVWRKTVVRQWLDDLEKAQG